jgi:hypothetical protein
MGGGKGKDGLGIEDGIIERRNAGRDPRFSNVVTNMGKIMRGDGAIVLGRMDAPGSDRQGNHLGTCLHYHAGYDGE